MSLTRTTPDSPREIKDPKRRSFYKDHSLYSTRDTPDSSGEKTDTKRIDLKVLNKEPSGIDTLEALPRSIRPHEPLPVGILSPIDLLVDEISIKRLAEILVISDEFVEKAKAAKRILEDGNSNSDQGVEKLKNLVCEFWLNQCFINGLRTISERENMLSMVVYYANQDSAHQRWKRMKEDPLLEPYLTSLDSPAATNSDIMRLFLSIFFGYWSDKDVLTKLDGTMGNFFIERLDREKPKNKLYVEKRDIKNFIYLTKDIGDSKKKLKLVQEWLVSTYGKEKSVNTDALLDEIESKLSRYWVLSYFYDGKEAKIKIQVVDGLYAFVKIDPFCKR